jgi:hypothetical protein
VERDSATADLEFIASVMRRTQTAVDPHAFHFILWGSLVLVCYPLLNWLQDSDSLAAMAWVGGGALAIGALGSFFTEMRLAKKPRVAAEDTFVTKQIVMVVWANLVPGILVSSFGPATGLVDGRYIPVVWGLLYANMAFMVGVVYLREYLIAGIAIGVGALLAALNVDYAGYILGPFMGLGMIVPGIIAERRVGRLAKETGGA